MVTLRDLLETTARQLATAGLHFGHGTSSAWDEATSLVLAVTGHPDNPEFLSAEIDAGHIEQVNLLLTRRITERIPLPYLTGTTVFAGLEFTIAPGVVVPRSPIAELIARDFSPWLDSPPAAILDMCCGLGCIGIAAALKFPEATLTLIDMDPAALALARRNVARHGLESRTRILCSDLFSALPPERFDLLLANPPYVDDADMRALPAEYRHEPATGLAGGSDGLDLVRRLLAALPERLTSRGLLVCEVGRSAGALSRAYPDLPFIWLDLEHGGEGVFALLPEAGASRVP